jgi:hypothetical protein
MYLMLSLLVAVGVTLFVVSKIAKMLLAKRSGLEWITVASIVSALIAVVTYVTLNIYVAGLEPMMMLGITFGAMILFSSIAFKVINQMSWGAAIATNVANVVIMLATAIGAIVLNGESLNKMVDSITHSAKSNTMMVSSMVKGTELVEPASTEVGIPEEDMLEDSESEPMITELELLPKAEIKEEQKEKTIFVAPKYHVVSIDNIKSFVGKSLKIHTIKDTVIIGQLQQVKGNDAMLYRRVNGGTAITPIEFSSIKKLEVYR